MLSVSQWLALPHLAPSKRCLSSNIQKQLSNKTDQDKEKTEKKERKKKKRVSSRKDCSVGNGGAKSMISPRRRLEGIDEKESDRVRGRKREREKERKGERGKGRKGEGEKERKRDRVSAYIYPPPSDVHPQTSRTSVGNLYLRCDVRRCDNGGE